jgi:hypothetical protein
MLHRQEVHFQRGRDNPTLIVWDNPFPSDPKKGKGVYNATQDQVTHNLSHPSCQDISCVSPDLGNSVEYSEKEIRIMKRFIVTFCCINMFPALGFGADGSNAEKVVRFQPVQEAHFFANAQGQDDTTSLILRYKRFPLKDKAIPNAENLYIVMEFQSWMNELLKSEYVPSHEFVAENLRLYPANDAGRKEDVAILAFDLPGKRFLIAQTGAWDKFWFYARDNTLPDVQEKQEANLRAQRAVSEYIREDYQPHIPELELLDVPVRREMDYRGFS